MTAQAIEPGRWSPGRWWTFVGLVLLAQLALILWLGRPHPAKRASKDSAPVLRLAGPAAASLLALTDPTLFALPHVEGFSGPAWLTIPAQIYQPSEPSEPDHWLTLSREKLGSSFNQFLSTNTETQLPVFAQPDLVFKQPVVVESPLFPTQSVMRLTGGLADRRLIVPPALPSWTNSEILTNSVVQVIIGADGKPLSAPTLLKPPASGGPTEADLFALREARKLRFEPLTGVDPLDPMAGLVVGQLIFEWHTLPVPTTNAPSGP
ncbi:MAG TPA: hypothetical protein VKY92_06550 [Verrucomicrobiae bacterium]|jgi:hypothetical protein|nr:hypothetical protein [Verrucomicrobiae bacterium]